MFFTWIIIALVGLTVASILFKALFRVIGVVLLIILAVFAWNYYQNNKADFDKVREQITTSITQINEKTKIKENLLNQLQPLLNQIPELKGKPVQSIAPDDILTAINNNPSLKNNPQYASNVDQLEQLAIQLKAAESTKSSAQKQFDSIKSQIPFLN
jgi:energy-coupling factor transporter transmembrane protein EcfT